MKKHPDDILIGTLQRFSRKHLIEIGKLITQGMYANRAEFIREAVQEKLDRIRKLK